MLCMASMRALRAMLVCIETAALALTYIQSVYMYNMHVSTAVMF
jgi:hypothetical protein